MPIIEASGGTKPEGRDWRGVPAVLGSTVDVVQTGLNRAQLEPPGHTSIGWTLM
jgi:hypothetical protein